MSHQASAGRVARVIASGGMGTVYRAYDTVLDAWWRV